MRHVALGLFVALFFIAHAVHAQTEPLEEVPCFYVANGGRDVYDLSPLKKKSGSSDWKVTFDVFTYYLNVCRELNLKDANPGVGAFETGPSNKYPLGVIASNHIQYSGPGTIRINFAAGDFGLCQAYINLTCGSALGKPVYGGKFSDCGHFFNWESNAACSQAASSQNCDFDGYYFDISTGCTICPANSRCERGTKTECSDGESSPAGSTTCTATCQDGFYPTVPHLPATCAVCPPGFICKNGIQSTCPGGQYPVEGIYCHMTTTSLVFLVLCAGLLSACVVLCGVGILLKRLQAPPSQGNGEYQRVNDNERGYGSTSPRAEGPPPS